MWRSKARAFINGSLLLLLHPRLIESQVPAETLILVSSSTPISSKWVPPAGAHFRNPRFFSSGTTTRIDSSASDAFEVEINGNSVSGGDPDSISPESDASLLDSAMGITGDAPSWNFGDEVEGNDVFGENPDAIMEESGDASLDFDKVKDELEVEGESLSSLWKENNEDGDTMGIFASKEGTSAAGQEIDGVLIEKVLSILQSSSEDPLDLSLDKMDLVLSEEFVARIIQSPDVSCEKMVGFYRWASQYIESVKNTRVIELLVSAVSTSSDLSKDQAYMLWDLVKEISKEKGLLTTGILNQLISMFRELGKAKAALEVFDKFTEFGCDPDGNSYYFTIGALGKRSMIDAAWSVCEKMLKSGSFPDSEKIGEIITFFCKGKKAKEAHLVYLKAKKKKIHTPISSLDFLIGGLVRKGETIHEALGLLKDYSGDSLKNANRTFGSVVHGLCKINDLKKAKKLLLQMVDSGPPPRNAAFNYVITALAKEGDIEEALSFVKVMESRGLRPDIYAYNVIMSGLAKGGLMEEVYKIFCEAKRKHPKLTGITYHILIRGYCKMEEYDKALDCLKEMKEDGLQPNTDEYNKIIQTLCLKALDWRTAEKLMEEMKESGLYLKGATRSLIAAVKELEEEEMASEPAKLEAELS